MAQLKMQITVVGQLGQGLAIGALRFLDHTVNDATRPLVAAYTRALMAEPFARLGWSSTADQSERTATLRGQLLAMLGTVGQDADIRRLGELAALAGVVKFPVRIKCATLAWNTLIQALDELPAPA